MKKFIMMLSAMLPIMAVNVYGFSDVPKGHWAESYITRVYDAGIMQGVGNNEFGFGQNVKKSEFITMLCNMMNWEVTKKEGVWYEPYVEAGYKHGIIDSLNISANDFITRKEMAEMLIKSLGFNDIETDGSPFRDVNNSYITAAHDFGIISGKGNGFFAPSDFASREETASMMCRFYDKYNKNIEHLHGFYAISSWNQRELAQNMDSISFGWSRLEYDNGVLLNTTSSNNNDWAIPEGSEDAVNYFRSKNIPENLAVIMNTSQKGEGSENACETILLNDNNRKKAVELITNAALDFNGVTIDFEGMKGEELKNGFNLFLAELREKLPDNKLIYTAVHPVMAGEYYNAYDYSTIGELSDMIILMAHDYGANYMNEKERNSGFTTTPVTPFNQVYIAIKSICEQVNDKNKIAMAISAASTTCWILDNDGKVTNEYSVHPDTDTVEKRLAQKDTVIEYSQKYRNPKATYTNDKGQKVVLWYENYQSISDKIILAKMFGINKISVWRIGQIQNDIWSAIEENR